jgi:hypothetical protein
LDPVHRPRREIFRQSDAPNSSGFGLATDIGDVVAVRRSQQVRRSGEIGCGVNQERLWCGITALTVDSLDCMIDWSKRVALGVAMTYDRAAALDAMYVISITPTATPNTWLKLLDEAGVRDWGRDESLGVVLGEWAPAIAGNFTEQEMARVRTGFGAFGSRPASTSVADCGLLLLKLLRVRSLTLIAAGLQQEVRDAR